MRPDVAAKKPMRNTLYTILIVLIANVFASVSAQQNKKPEVRMQAKLFYQDKGTFSEDVSVPNDGPPYVPPSHWNTPTQYEKRSSSVFVSIEVAGDVDQKQLEFSAKYVPWQREHRPITIVKRVVINTPLKVGETDSYHAGFWLYDTGCNPVVLTARIVGLRSPVIKRVIKFGCGE